MLKLFPLLQIFLLGIALFLFITKGIYAGNNLCQQTKIQVDTKDDYNTIVTIDTRIDLNRNGQAGETLQIFLENGRFAIAVVPSDTNDPNFGLAIFKLGKLIPGGYSFALSIMETDQNGKIKSKTGRTLCNGKTYDGAVFSVPDVGQGGATTPTEGKIEIIPHEPKPNDPIKIIVKDLPENAIYFASITDKSRIKPTENNQYQCKASTDKTIEFSFNPLLNGTWDVIVLKKKDQADPNSCVGECQGGTNKCQVASGEITIKQPNDEKKSQGCQPGDNCTSAGGEVCNIVDGKKATSDEVPPGSGIIEYVDSAGQVIPHEKRGVFTALGCIPTQPQPLIEGILKFAFGIGGGIALLLMVYGAFQMITSGGNPDNVKRGSEQFTQAIIGLLFIIFSVLLLQIIGADILNIPGFGK